MKIIVIILSLYFPFSLLAQKGPGGIGNTDGNSKLEFWFNAEKQVYSDSAATLLATPINSTKVRIGRWTDLSGKNRHACMNTTPFKPGLVKKNSILNNRNTIQFNRGINTLDTLNKLKFFANPFSDSLTILLVFHALEKGGGNNNDGNGGLSPDQFYYGAGLICAEQPGIQNEYSICWTDTSLGLGVGNSSASSDLTIKTGSSRFMGHLGIASWCATGVSTIMQDGGSSKSSNLTSTSTRNSNQITIGAINTGMYDVNHFDGYMAQVIAFSKILTPIEEIILNNYLSSAYNIAISQNDFYTRDNPIEGDFDFEMAAIGKANDGSTQSNSQGESIFIIKNASDLQNNEYLFWAHNNATGTSNDVPPGFNNRISKTWISQEIGETGQVQIQADVAGLMLDTARIYLLIDTNNNGSFGDEIKGLGVIKGIHIGNGLIDFGYLNIGNNQFTIADEHTCNITSLGSLKIESDCKGPAMVTINESKISNATLPFSIIVQNLTTNQIVNFSQHPIELGEGVYSISIRDSFFCQHTLSSNEKISYCNLSFSPNGDGIRDDFYVDKKGKAKIYDKNGNLIHEFSAPAYWNGDNKAGQQAPGGYYLILINDESIYVTLIR